MNILVTGSTGFVGQHLCRKLIESHNVYALARNEGKFNSLKVSGTLVKGNLENFKWVDSLPTDLDVVVHVAGLVHSHDDESFFKVNEQATRNLVNKLKNKYPNLRFVLISSLAAFGPADKIFGNLDENDMPTPVSAYGHSKLSQERVLIREAPETWQKVIIRPPMVIGPGDEAFVDVFAPVAKKVKLYIGKKGKKKEYSFVCVHDLVETISLCLEKDFSMTESFFSAYPMTFTYEELMREAELQLKVKAFDLVLPEALLGSLAALTGVLKKHLKIDLRLTKDKLNEIRPQRWVCNASKSQEVLGQEYKWDLTKTVKTTLNDFKERNLI